MSEHIESVCPLDKSVWYVNGIKNNCLVYNGSIHWYTAASNKHENLLYFSYALDKINAFSQMYENFPYIWVDYKCTIIA